MKTNPIFRAEARRALDGKWGDMVLLTFLFLLITQVASLPSNLVPLFTESAPGLASSLNAAGILLTLLLLPMSWSYTITLLRNHRGEPTGLSNLFDGYRDFSRIFTTILLQGIYIFLWSILLIIPGIIKSFSYALTPYILKDEPGLSNNAAIERSMEMMEGHKMQLFLLMLSFIGWIILAIFTCGIGFLWLSPYMYAATAAFYEDVKAEFETKSAAAPAEKPAPAAETNIYDQSEKA